MGNNNQIEKTALFKQHVKLNAKIVDFANYKMPISYEKGIISEYHCVRNSVGMFDISHMGEFEISGKGALDFLQKVTINNVSKLNIGHAQYSAMCLENGGIIDDLILYRMADKYLMVVNAANIQKNYLWLNKHIKEDVKIENISNKISLIAIQGPKSKSVLENISDKSLNIPFYTFINCKINDCPVLLSRTGYTGELGYEIYTDHDSVNLIWNELIKKGVSPIGLAARDILRLEMNYCLYGNDIDDCTNPLEAGLSWITSFNKGDFIGLNTLKKIKLNGTNRQLIAFTMEDKGIPRKGYEILTNNQVIGSVTSGTQSPKLKKGIGLGYVESTFSKYGKKIKIKIRNKKLEAKIIKPPFLKSTSLHLK